MRKYGRVDANQADIVDALRDAGCSVVVLSAVGGGVWDIVVGRAGINYLLEIKDGSKPPSQRKRTPAQVRLHAEWRGQQAVCKTVEEAFIAVGILRG